jgi:hypothetical protein
MQHYCHKVTTITSPRLPSRVLRGRGCTGGSNNTTTSWEGTTSTSKCGSRSAAAANTHVPVVSGRTLGPVKPPWRHTSPKRVRSGLAQAHQAHCHAATARPSSSLTPTQATSSPRTYGTHGSPAHPNLDGAQRARSMTNGLSRLRPTTAYHPALPHNTPAVPLCHHCLAEAEPPRAGRETLRLPPNAWVESGLSLPEPRELYAGSLWRWQGRGRWAARS